MGADFPAIFERMARLADILKISDEDLAQIYPAMDVPTALAQVQRIAPTATLLYTRGALGITLYSPLTTLEQPTFSVAVVDTVGAGDACIGGYLASLLQQPQRELAVHLRYAAATAAAACVEKGAHAPTPAEVSALLSA